MVSDILTPMNHREIEYNAKKLSGCNIPDSFSCAAAKRERQRLLGWLDETGKRVFDEDLVMDYGTDCLRLYLLFERTPKEKDAPCYESWQEGALEGLYKFLGRYRRMILAAGLWNELGRYDAELFAPEQVRRLEAALDTADTRIAKCISRGNTMPNRHNLAAALMELLNVFQKELRTGEIVTALHAHAVETAVPQGFYKTPSDTERAEPSRKNAAVTALCQQFVMRMAPYAPDLSRVLWETFGSA